MEVGALKRRFGVVGNSPALERALTVAAQVATTDISVLVLGESGTGKEVMPRIVHQFSSRKHGPYVAVNAPFPRARSTLNCLARSFTGAAPEGYFEEANGGTIFREVAELPLTTQVRLLRVLETGEFMKVGSPRSKNRRRVVAATNVDFDDAMARGSSARTCTTVSARCHSTPSASTALGRRAFAVPEVHHGLQRAVPDAASEFGHEAVNPRALPWPGNIRQLKNGEQMSILKPIEDRRHPPGLPP